MRNALLSILLILCCFPVSLTAQRDSLRDDFINAESWFLFEEYNEAEALYQKLLEVFPENDNLKYRIGICLLNDPYREEQSIAYLLDASDNIDAGWKESSFKETSAPPDVLYYLGNAYLANELLDEAIAAFERFLGIMDPEIYDEELVRAQIRACENARRLMSMPVDIDLHRLGPELNTRYADVRPVVSGDGKRMAFVTKQPFFDEALFVERTESGWSLPMSLTSMLGFDADIYPVALNYDGTEMLLYYDEDLIGNLYISRFEEGFWTPAEILGENISTKFWESHGCFSRDGKTLYFTSNRKGSLGGLDIYRSERQPNGSWGVPVNLGPTINTRYNEESPFITEDGNTLYFSSYGHFNMGGYDIFYSRRDENGRWGEPVNLGYPINTTGDDLNFQPVNNGFGGYHARYLPEGEGRFDLYYMDIYSANNPRRYLVTGTVRAEEGEEGLAKLRMYVIDPVTGDTLAYQVPIGETGAFELDLVQGEYQLVFTGEGYTPEIRPLRITPGSDKEGIRLDDVVELSLVPRVPRVFVGDESKIRLRDSVYTAVAGEPLEIPLRLERGGTLVTRLLQDTVLIRTDTTGADRRRTKIEVLPPPGESILELEMIDEDGDIHRNRIRIVAALPEPPPAPVAQVPEEDPGETPAEEPGQMVPEAVDQLYSDLMERNGMDPLFLEILEGIDPEKEGIRTRAGLYESLYRVAREGGYDLQVVDRVLAEELTGEDARLLYQRLLENSSGPLNAYLRSLDLEDEGIRTPAELLGHLERVSGANGFTMEEVREALLTAPDRPLEVEQTVSRLLDDPDTEPVIREILEGLDLPGEGIYTVEDLIAKLVRELEERGYKYRKIKKLLEPLFPEYSGLVASLTSGERSGGKVLVWLLPVTGLLFLLLFLRRRRRKKEE